MKTILRTLSLGIVTALATSAFAQPTPPFNVTVAGYVAGCSPNSSVNILSVQGTQPAIDIDVPLDGNCGFSVALLMDSYQGWFYITTPCNGAVQSATGTYTVNSFFPDSNMVYVSFNCTSGNVDCMGITGGTALPGTPCDYFGSGLPAVWGADCVCDTIMTAITDCMGIANGPNLPGTACQNPNGTVGIWGADCVCSADTTNTGFDCLGIANGTNLPGSPCWLVPGTNLIGEWSANCECVEIGNPMDCEASFWVVQAYAIDSMNPNGNGTPVPNEVWVWNLSQGNPPMTYSWDFGDGATSTMAYPSHTYSENGPFMLCLTIADASGCTSTYCDSISIDENGILNGMIVDGETTANGARTNGFTLNVQNGLTTSMQETPALSNLAIWPNPATDELNMALVALADGSLNVTFFDVNGREMRQENRAISAGRNQQRFDIGELPAGLYTARATDRNGNSISLRFAKTK